MSLKRIYNYLPRQLEPVTKYSYYITRSIVHNARYTFGIDTRPEDYWADTASRLIGSEAALERYNREFEELEETKLLESARAKYDSWVNDINASWASISERQAKLLYSIIRDQGPDVAVETGVCNGVSTLAILAALEANNNGELYSVDYPIYANQTLPEFRKKSQPSSGNYSAIPQDKEPGWIIPESLTDRWHLRTGKSQVELPQLLSELSEIDFFMHDSEHSKACMMMEYELAWHHLREGGVMLSDDIHFNSAWEEWTNYRVDGLKGKISENVGWVVR